MIRRLLREDFRSGRLDAAPSKAEVLGELCDRLNFDQDAAAQLHKQLYREKLASVVEDKKITGALSGPPLSQVPFLAELLRHDACIEQGTSRGFAMAAATTSSWRSS